ncbi:unnamed protein product (macronuclear) [Paramecium tetraurelia]|uniref:Transmembrane protein n=1 Tax=Paramecium tetraurelia TaxID=5888 RepID=A0BW30_PARTE|nr:uncharacterized protein GSPATT00032599001 [Paramecium tetraurelia]CAK62747.1 unnamed protein product [Paramecium tetraurelia]|eukprot:XP_001430145.1 hypothetical protein (macronuclear) [Paramecium tetraurelia strain d4-2]
MLFQYFISQVIQFCTILLRIICRQTWSPLFIILRIAATSIKIQYLTQEALIQDLFQHCLTLLVKEEQSCCSGQGYDHQNDNLINCNYQSQKKNAAFQLACSKYKMFNEEQSWRFSTLNSFPYNNSRTQNDTILNSKTINALKNFSQ